MPVYLRAAVRAKVSYIFSGVSEVLAPDALGPFAPAPAPFVTRNPILNSVSIGAGGTIMAAVGAQTIILRGQWLGIDAHDIVVACTNGNVTVNTSICTVTVPNEELSCRTSPGVGYGFVWLVHVDGALSAAPPQFTSSFNLPTVLDSAHVTRGCNATTAVFTLSGRDFGPVGTPVERAFLYSPSDAAVIFDATNCNVTVADTTIVCDIPDGAGTDLLWSVVIGGQKSSARIVTYSVPEIHSVTCSPSPCDALATTGGDTIVVHGANFGPATRSPNFLAGSYGGVYFTASSSGSSSSRFALLACNVTTSQVQAACFTPSGFGLALSMTMTVLRQVSAPSVCTSAYRNCGGWDRAGATPLVATTKFVNTVIVTGNSFGAPALLLLDGLPVASAKVQAGHNHLVFTVPVQQLPLVVIGEPQVSVSVSLQGILSNTVPLAAAPHVLSATFPLAVTQDSVPPPGACPGMKAVYWVVVAGNNFGVNSSTTSLSVVGMPGTSGVCSIADTVTGGVDESTLVFGTNASTGYLAIVLGNRVRNMTSANVVFFAANLTRSPTLNSLQQLHAGSTTPGPFRTAGGDFLRIVGTNFHASDRVFLAPSGVTLSDAAPGSLPPETSLRECSTSASSITATTIDCVVPPGVGASHKIAVFARGAFVSNALLQISYAAPNVTRIVILSTEKQLRNAGGLISILGTSFGTQTANVTVLVGGQPCLIVGAVQDTIFNCTAPASDASSPIVEVNVGGQHCSVVGLLLYAQPKIYSIFPATLRTIGGGNLSINGSDFGVRSPIVAFVLPTTPRTIVYVTVLASTQTTIKVIIPRGVGTNVSIEVHTTSQVAVLPQCFEYLPPRIVSISPPSAAAGCSVDGCVLTMTGDNFGSHGVLSSGPRVLVNAGPCIVTNFSDTSISFYAPPGSGVHNTASVSVLDRTAVLNGTAFAYSRPSVSYVSPPVVDQRQIVKATLTLVGTNFKSTGLAINPSLKACGATPAASPKASLRRRLHMR